MLRGGLLSAALLIGSASISPAFAQGDVSNRTDQPDPTAKKDGLPPGVKKDTTKATKQKSKPPAKTATKTGKKGRDKNMAAMKRIVLVFPVDAKGQAAEQITDVITDVEKARLSATGQFGAVSFLTSLPSVRRAVSEQSLTNADVNPPFATLAKAQKLTTTAGYDAAIISSLDSYEYNADDQNVSIVLSIQLIDYSGSTPRSFTAADSVKTAAKSAKNATDTTASGDATRNLAERLMTDVLKSYMASKTSAAGTTTPAAK